MVKPTTTVISCIEAKLPVCNPNLMPFHIDYNGPAPVSAFMRVEKFKSDILNVEMGAKEKIFQDISSGVKALDELTVDEDMNVLEAPSTETSDVRNNLGTNAKAPGSQTISESTAVVESQTSLASDTTRVSFTPPVLEDEDKRFVSTFRGRTIHGLTIDLPLGYSGLVLRGEGDSNKKPESQEDGKDKTKVKAQSTNQKASTSGKKKTTVTEKPATKPRGRLTRSAVSKPAVITIEDEDQEMADAAAPDPSSENVNEQLEGVDDIGEKSNLSIRNLVPQAQFSFFTLWHADRPVDKASDEYYRSLTEWIALSQEIHRTGL